MLPGTQEFLHAVDCLNSVKAVGIGTDLFGKIG
jgi:hypothetical protein